MTNDLYIDDNGMAVFGTGEDLQIYHDASHSWMKNTTGNIVIHTGTGRFKVWSDGNEEMIDAAPGGGVKLCYNDSSKLETISTGVNITGGIRLGGDNAVNEMDDYEEGVHNPSITSNGGGSITLKSAQDTLAYTKVGRIVNASAIITRNETGSRTGMLTVSHLPYTSYTAHSQLCAGTWWMDRGFGNDTVGGVCYIPGNGTRIHFVNPTAVHTNAGGDDADDDGGDDDE